MPGTHTEHLSRGTAGTPPINPEAEAQRIERLGLNDRMGRVKYAPSEEECRRILGISQGASLDDARARFRALSRAFHPDSTSMSDKARAAGLFAMVQRAWDEIEGRQQSQPPQVKRSDRLKDRDRTHAPHLTIRPRVTIARETGRSTASWHDFALLHLRRSFSCASIFAKIF